MPVQPCIIRRINTNTRPRRSLYFIGSGTVIGTVPIRAIEVPQGIKKTVSFLLWGRARNRGGNCAGRNGKGFSLSPVEVAAMPPFEYHQLPEAQRVIARPG